LKRHTAVKVNPLTEKSVYNLAQQYYRPTVDAKIQWRWNRGAGDHFVPILAPPYFPPKNSAIGTEGRSHGPNCSKVPIHLAPTFRFRIHQYAPFEVEKSIFHTALDSTAFGGLALDLAPTLKWLLQPLLSSAILHQFVTWYDVHKISRTKL